MAKKNELQVQNGKTSRRVNLQPGKDAAGAELFRLSRIPPQAVPLEQAVLGALMLDKDAIHIVADLLKEAAFYQDGHQLIYGVMLRLYEKSQPIDLLTVMEGLRKAGRLGEVGGPAYLAELTNKVASSANIEYHCRLLQQYQLKRQILNLSKDIEKQGYDDTTDAFELLDYLQNGTMEIAQGISRKDATHISVAAAEFLKEMLDGPQGEGMQGIPTGWIAVDELTGGLHDSDLVILAARPAMGKTAMALDIARRAAAAGKAVHIFSLEMSEKQLLQRQAAQVAQVSAAKFRKGTLTIADKEVLTAALEQLGELNIYIDDTAGLDILELRAKAKRAKMKRGIGLIIIDYIQQIDYQGKDAYNREQAVAKITRELKNLAKELNVPILALAQLSRAVETRGGSKRPQLSDLRESGQIEQEADLIAFLYRPEYYNILEDEAGNSLANVAEVIIAKNRHGELATAKLRWEGAFTRFSDLEDTAFPPLPADGPFPAPPMILRPSRLNDDADVPF